MTEKERQQRDAEISRKVGEANRRSTGTDAGKRAS
jgi:hypothetical protein